MIRAVLDTNVLVSAVISDGKPRLLLRKGIENRFSIITSDLILREVVTVLRRPKFKASQDEIGRVILALIQSAEVVSVTSDLRVVLRDRKDDLVINTAADSKADFIVTGDHHLLELKKFGKTEMLTVDAMLGILR